MTDNPTLAPCTLCETANPECPECWGTGQRVAYDLTEALPVIDGSALTDAMTGDPGHFFHIPGGTGQHAAHVEGRRVPFATQVGFLADAADPLAAFCDALRSLTETITGRLAAAGMAVDPSTARWTLMNTNLSLGGADAWARAFVSGHGSCPPVPGWIVTDPGPGTLTLEITAYTDSDTIRAYIAGRAS